MKKVIFIGGTSYSGSTLLDMIIANDKKGFSCGELSSLFYPKRKHHLDYKCGCGDNNCTVWKKILENGKKGIYEKIFSLFPNITYIVDSSKDPLWIQQQKKDLEKKNIKISNVLIYKTPYESAHSFKKRGRLKSFEKSWVNYHRLYLSIVKNSNIIKYSSLVSDRTVLEKICNILELRYYTKKEEYWQKKHHTLFGNTSAKMHLMEQSDDAIAIYKKKLKNSGRNEKNIKKEFKKVYYQDIIDKELKGVVEKITKNNPYVDLIYKYLENSQVGKKKQKEINKIEFKDLEKLKMSKVEIQCRQIKRNINVTLFKHLNREVGRTIFHADKVVI